MTNDLRKLLGLPSEEAMRQLTTMPSSVIERELSRFQRLGEDMIRSTEISRLMLGPNDDVLRMLKQHDQLLTPDLARFRDVGQELAQRFRLPLIDESARLLSEYSERAASQAMAYSRVLDPSIQRAIESMRAPWLDSQNECRSIAGFIELQWIGETLRVGTPFDETIAELLRVDLGDWRADIAWPEVIFDDPAARSSFYVERGFNSELTEFPPAAFEETVALAGLVDAVLGGEPEEEVSGEEKLAFRRTNKAQGWLLRFEITLRHFIVQRMFAVHGEQWMKQKIAGDMLQRWREKQQAARDAGQPERPLIEFADFADYLPIIERKDNWKDVFGAVFKHRESVQESFRRLRPIRICAMHSRLITQDDELYMFVETKRIVDAIRRLDS